MWRPKSKARTRPEPTQVGKRSAASQDSNYQPKRARFDAGNQKRPLLPSVYVSDVPVEFRQESIGNLHQELQLDVGKLVSMKLLPSKFSSNTRCCILRYEDYDAAENAVAVLRGHPVDTSDGAKKFLGAKMATPASWMVQEGLVESEAPEAVSYGRGAAAAAHHKENEDPQEEWREGGGESNSEMDAYGEAQDEDASWNAGNENSHREAGEEDDHGEDWESTEDHFAYTSSWSSQTVRQTTSAVPRPSAAPRLMAARRPSSRYDHLDAPEAGEYAESSAYGNSGYWPERSSEEIQKSIRKPSARPQEKLKQLPNQKLLPSIYLSDVPVEFLEEDLRALHRSLGIDDASFVTAKLLPPKSRDTTTRCCILRYTDDDAADLAIGVLSGYEVTTCSGATKYLGAKIAAPAQWMVQEGLVKHAS